MMIQGRVWATPTATAATVACVVEYSRVFAAGENHSLRVCAEPRATFAGVIKTAQLGPVLRALGQIINEDALDEVSHPSSQRPSCSTPPISFDSASDSAFPPTPDVQNSGSAQHG
jgi:hypothetical protein